MNEAVACFRERSSENQEFIGVIGSSALKSGALSEKRIPRYAFSAPWGPMFIGLKAVLHQRLSEAELMRAASSFLTDPPFPGELRAAMAEVPADAIGKSWLDWWREKFAAHIQHISSGATWKLQRSELLKTVIAEQEWTALEKAANAVSNCDALVAVAADTLQELQHLTNEQRRPFAGCRTLPAAGNIACLIALGSRLYDVDQVKRWELDLVGKLQTDTRTFQGQIIDSFWNAVDSGNAQTLGTVARDPTSLLDQRWGFLRTCIEAVVYSQLDLADFAVRYRDLEIRTRAYDSSYS